MSDGTGIVATALSWGQRNTGATVSAEDQRAAFIDLAVVVLLLPDDHVGVAVAVDVPGGADAPPRKIPRMGCFR